jgi:hypothetical protein
MKNLFKEPLVHFFLLGAGLFVLFQWVGDPASDVPTKIVVTADETERLAENFRKWWLRPPTEQELKQLVDDYVREEVLYREAVAMGLDKNDTVIRRRMRQKMRFLFEDLAEQREPTDEELQAYLNENAEFFRIGPRVTFLHVYLNPDLHGNSLRGRAESLLEKLRRSTEAVDVEDVGDPITIPYAYEDASRFEVTRVFGASFARELLGLPPGQWQGPIESGCGMHLVLVQNRTASRIPELAEVRETVKRELQNARRREANEKMYQRLLEGYSVVIESLHVTGLENRGGTTR